MMPDHELPSDNPEQDEQPGKSKTQIKKEMQALRDLGAALIELSNKQLAQIPLDSELLEAIELARRLKQREARRRQLQYIGKLMRAADHEAIETAYQKLMEKHHLHTQRHHHVEQWRDRLLSEGNSCVGEFMQRYPHTNSQQLRQLIRGAQKEQQQNKPPAQARKLFRYILEVTQESD